MKNDLIFALMGLDFVTFDNHLKKGTSKKNFGLYLKLRWNIMSYNNSFFPSNYF